MRAAPQSRNSAASRASMPRAVVANNFMPSIHYPAAAQMRSDDQEDSKPPMDADERPWETSFEPQMNTDEHRLFFWVATQKRTIRKPSKVIPPNQNHPCSSAFIGGSNSESAFIGGFASIAFVTLDRRRAAGTLFYRSSSVPLSKPNE